MKTKEFGHKKVNGRKRQVMVYTNGLVWASRVHAANLSDTEMGCELFAKIKDKPLKLQKLILDAGYRGTFEEQVKEQLEVTVEISSRLKDLLPLPNDGLVNEHLGGLISFAESLKVTNIQQNVPNPCYVLANCAIVINRIT